MSGERITTAAELEALAYGSVVLGSGTAFQKDMQGGLIAWSPASGGRRLSSMGLLINCSKDTVFLLYDGATDPWVGIEAKS